MCEISLEANVATEKGNDRHETGVLNKEMELDEAVQSCL